MEAIDDQRLIRQMAAVEGHCLVAARPDVLDVVEILFVELVDLRRRLALMRIERELCRAGG